MCRKFIFCCIDLSGFTLYTSQARCKPINDKSTFFVEKIIILVYLDTVNTDQITNVIWWTNKDHQGLRPIYA